MQDTSLAIPIWLENLSTAAVKKIFTDSADTFSLIQLNKINIG